MLTTKLFSKPILRLSVVILVNENLLAVTPLISKETKHRHFARWSARKPSKVYLSDELSSGSIDSTEFVKSQYEDGDSQAESFKSDTRNETRNEITIKESSLEENAYVVLDEHDFTFSKMMTQVRNRNMRRKNNLMMLEGKRLNIDALQAGLKPKKIFFTQKSYLEELNLQKGMNIPLFKLPHNTLRLWSKLESPPGVIGFYGIPSEGEIKTVCSVPIKVICDNVRDPGNMGAIIRVAAAVGCTHVLLMKGCTDPWDSKVLRSASGGHFHIPIHTDLTWQEHQEFLLPEDVVLVADSSSSVCRPGNRNLNLQLYHDFDYSRVSGAAVVVVIGGETEGISSDALQLASSHNGSRLYIPLSNCMESLNSGCALSVILFEIKRQLSITGNRSNQGQKALEEIDNIVISRSGSV